MWQQPIGQYSRWQTTRYFDRHVHRKGSGRPPTFLPDAGNTSLCGINMLQRKKNICCSKGPFVRPSVNLSVCPVRVPDSRTKKNKIEVNVRRDRSYQFSAQEVKGVKVKVSVAQLQADRRIICRQWVDIFFIVILAIEDGVLLHPRSI